MQTAHGFDALGFVFAVGVIDTLQERRFRTFEKGPVVGTSAGATADGDDVGGEGRVHTGPIVSLLGAHGEADDGVEVRDV